MVGLRSLGKVLEGVSRCYLKVLPVLPGQVLLRYRVGDALALVGVCYRTKTDRSFAETNPPSRAVCENSTLLPSANLRPVALFYGTTPHVAVKMGSVIVQSLNWFVVATQRIHISVRITCT